MPTESANGAIIRDTHDWSGDLEGLHNFGHHHLLL
jgi:hypothetical protein